MKRAKKNGSTGRKSNFGWLVIAILCLLTVLFFVIYWQWSIHTSLAKNVWRTNILIKSTSPTVISFPNNYTDKIFVLVLPKEAETVVPHGYGMYRLEALPTLGEIENMRYLSAEAVEDMLGLQLKSTVDVQGDVDAGEVLSSLKRMISFVSEVNWEKKNYFNTVDSILLRIKLMLLDPADVLVYDLRDDRYLFPTKTTLDQSQLLTINQKPLDEFIESKFTQELVRTENLTVSIHNTTGVSGAGNKFARYISNIGGKVLRVENDTAEIENCQIRVKQENEQSVLVQYLKKEFDCVSLASQEGDIVDIVILVGKYFAKRWG